MTPVRRKRPLEASSPLPIFNLPTEIITEIFTYLQERRDLHSAYLSCKRFKSIIDQWPRNNFRFHIENNPLISGADVVFMQKFASKLETFSLHNVSALSPVCAFNDKVTHMTLRNIIYSEENLIANFPKLRSLDISHSIQIPRFRLLPENLEILTLNFYQLFFINALPKKLSHLIISCESWDNIIFGMNRFQSLKNLKSLHIVCPPSDFKQIFERSLSPITITEGKIDYSTPSCKFSCSVIARNLTFQMGECIYEGPLKNCLPHGQGELKYKNETVFQGVFHEGTIIEGQGWLVLKFGKISNFWTNSVIILYDNGDSFSGNFNGEGVYEYSNGRKFCGTFKDGLPYTGFGAKLIGKANWYEGGLLNGKYHGFGRYFNDNSYEGYFENGRAVGSFLVIMPGRAPFKTNHPFKV